MTVAYSFISDSPAQVGTPIDMERMLEALAVLGYQGVELPLAYPYDFEPSHLEGACANAGLAVVAFMTGWSYFNEHLALCSPDPAVRERAVGRLIGHLEVAARFNALLVVGQMQGFRSDE